MGRKLGVTLAVAMLMFVLVPMASADLITTPTGILVIPDDSQITAVLFFPPATFGVDFQFPGGTGSAIGNFNDGDQTSITFTTPVTNLSVDLRLATDVVEIFPFDVFPCSAPLNACPETLDLTLGGPTSDLLLDTFPGFGGIDELHGGCRRPADEQPCFAWVDRTLSVIPPQGPVQGRLESGLTIPAASASFRSANLD
jgi:hypothetical protein